MTLAWLPVDVTTVSDPHDEHGKFLVLNLIDNSVIADSDAPQAVQLSFENRPCIRARFQQLNVLGYAQPLHSRNTRQSLECALFNRDRVNHPSPYPNPRKRLLGLATR
ncbi:hypothetical protein SAMN05216526_0145 [Ectothiorhodosinus mongolicus]|uniref:Uncharacterized protein n=1 Tax=Ectothiorhodosinus mongolicus TaxID=233100 RepID=A0A1R3VP18_9GAMM|nr:hypothetical protein SAMN05216526_0145 [Ectothiorhodosinus mongolicus]